MLGEAPIEQPAQLIDCRDFTSPDPDLGREFAVVTVPVVVKPDGAVGDVGTPRANRSPRDQRVLDRAVSLARSCLFEPASRDGTPVNSRVDVQFRLAVGNLREVIGSK
jgi:hypothetical protein